MEYLAKTEWKALSSKFLKFRSIMKDFQKLAWLILSKPIKNWIDQDVDKLMVEATRFAR